MVLLSRYFLVDNDLIELVISSIISFVWHADDLIESVADDPIESVANDSIELVADVNRWKIDGMLDGEKYHFMLKEKRNKHNILRCYYEHVMMIRWQLMNWS